MILNHYPIAFTEHYVNIVQFIGGPLHGHYRAFSILFDNFTAQIPGQPEPITFNPRPLASIPTIEAEYSLHEERSWIVLDEGKRPLFYYIFVGLQTP